MDDVRDDYSTFSTPDADEAQMHSDWDHALKRVRDEFLIGGFRGPFMDSGSRNSL